MSLSRNVTVPVGNCDKGPPSVLALSAASAHINDLPRSTMTRK